MAEDIEGEINIITKSLASTRKQREERESAMEKRQEKIKENRQAVKDLAKVRSNNAK